MFRTSHTSKLISLILSTIISATVVILAAQAQEKDSTSARPDAFPTSISVLDSTKHQDGLIGPVRQVRTERAELSMKSGKLIEGPRSLLSTAVYDLQGISIDNTYYLVNERNHNVVGKEEYKHDDKGNVTEVTLRNTQGAILSREVYSYEFDVFDNWKKMVASLVIYEGGRLSYEPVEVTYRTISYFTEAIAKVADSPSPQRDSPMVPSALDTDSPGNETTARSDDNLNPSTVARGSTVNSGPVTDASTAGATVTSKQQGSLTIQSDRDRSEDHISKPQARLFLDGAANNQVIKIPNAIFPDEAKNAGVTGTVAVLVEIDIEGKVVAARPLNGHAMLRASAVEAALKSRFSPGGKNRTSNRSGVISFTFSLVQ